MNELNYLRVNNNTIHDSHSRINGRFMETKTAYSRKQFLQKAGSTALFATLGISFIPGCKDNSTGPKIDDDNNTPPAIVISGQTITIDLTQSSVSALKSASGWMLIKDATTLVINIDGINLRAFSSVCTHLGCSDNWSFSNSEFICGCHGSRYNTSGQVVKGPAPSDLKEYEVERSGDTVTITRS